MAKNTNHPPKITFLQSSFWHGFISHHAQVSNPSEQKQAGLSTLLALTLALINLIGGIANYQQRSFENLLLVFGIPIAISVFAYIIIKLRFVSIGSFLLVSGFCASGFSTIVRDNADVRITVLLYVPIALMIGSAILSSWAIFLLTGLSVGMIFLLPVMGVNLPKNISDTAGLVTAFGIVLVLINNFRQGIETQRVIELERSNQELEEIRSNLEERVAERTRALDRRSAQLEAASFVARSAAEIHDLKTLLDDVTTQITARFGFYHVGIFLTDEASVYVTLAAASSPGGQIMLARGHKLDIGRNNGIVGSAAHQKHTRISQDVSVDTGYSNNLDLPETHSEIAIPLLTQNQLIGVLDIQSTGINAFSAEDVFTLQTMTDQIALAIENNRLIEKSRIAILNLEAANAWNTKNNWENLLSSNGMKGYTYTPLGVFPINEHSSNPEIKPAIEKTLKIFLNLRGNNIGSITLKRNSNMVGWSDSEKEMAQLIATQVALAIENARLLEDTHKRALHEQTVNGFSTIFNRSLNVNTLLQNAVRELHSIPHVAEISILINPPE